ncbi:MAG: ABC transporter permease [Acidobacteriia bacterium]|nr:ABC transporter permease [Terriglobia bacterium]
MASGESELARSWRQFQNAFRLAMDSIQAHKLRSFLTLLGVIIGVASVILVGAAIDGLDVYAQESTSKAFGAESFIVAQIAAGRITRTEYFQRLKRNKPIRDADLRFVKAVSGDDVLYSPYQNNTADVKRENFTCEDTAITGVSADIATIRDVGVTDGRFFTDGEERARLDVAVIGETVKDTLFPAGLSPLNKTIRIKGIDFTVVGVLEKLGSSFGRDQDKALYIPAGAYERIFGTGNGYAVFGRPRPGSGLSLQQGLDEARVALRTRFHTRPGEADNFDNITPDAVRGFIDNIMGMVAAVVVPVTGISLLVGGIVIMNIMLVSVTERTREIGLRKSLGARRGDIMLQILIEAVALACVGGTLGVATGGLLTLVIGRLFSLKLHMTLAYIALSIGVSSLVGIASGWYPASRAARLDPVVALRAE